MTTGFSPPSTTTPLAYNGSATRLAFHNPPIIPCPTGTVTSALKGATANGAAKEDIVSSPETSPRNNPNRQWIMPQFGRRPSPRQVRFCLPIF